MKARGEGDAVELIRAGLGRIQPQARRDPKPPKPEARYFDPTFPAAKRRFAKLHCSFPLPPTMLGFVDHKAIFCLAIFMGDEKGKPFADHLRGTAGADAMNGKLLNDVVTGNGGDDSVLGDKGNDTCNGNAGNDTIYGGTGNDYMWGDEGSFTALGAGRDLLCGGAGADVITGRIGADILSGGAGKDTFVYETALDSTFTSHGRITDFTPGLDHIHLRYIDANPGTPGIDHFTAIRRARSAAPRGSFASARVILKRTPVSLA